jgi:L-alanine-DL-glutamate epimerase-like enolase superfamily enzyme
LRTVDTDRRRRDHGAHRHRSRRLRRSARDGGHHRRHAWLHHRGHSQDHRAAIVGQEIANLNRITRLIQGALEKELERKAAVEIAVYDLFAQLYNAPLYKILGGGDPVITTDITISVDYIDKMVADSLAAVERGFESLKIKVGKDIELDVERVKAIYAAVEDRALIRVDANQAWTAKQAVFAIQTLEDAGVRMELVEQPVKAQDLEGMKYVTERVHTPIMADESVFGPTEVIELIRMRAADIINIKLMRPAASRTRCTSPTSRPCITSSA